MYMFPVLCVKDIVAKSKSILPLSFGGNTIKAGGGGCQYSICKMLPQ
jgi:hypothetical protein